MRLVYYRGPEDVLYSFFWVNEQNKMVSPSFTTEDEAKQWLIKSVTTIVEEPAPVKTEKKPDVIGSSQYSEAFNAGKMYAKLALEDENLLEKLADLEHQQWEKWARTVLEQEKISKDRKARWQSYFVPYDQLTDEVKEYDREYARKVLDILREHE